MQNLDKLKAKKDELRQNLAEAVRAADENKISAAMDNWMQFVSDVVMSEATGITAATDRNVLAARGVRQLTAAETKYYEDFIASARMETPVSPTGVPANLPGAMPDTIIESVMDDIRGTYPLLDKIDFVYTGIVTKFVVNGTGEQRATWGELNTAITKEFTAGLEVVDMTMKKLSAYMFITEDMLALGPAWLDRYVRAILADALAAGLEVGIVDGNGLKEPIGMTRNFAGNLNSSSGYSRKTATHVATLDPSTFGSLIGTMAKNGYTNKQRVIRRVMLIVNPADYFTKVMPATTHLTPLGTYVGDVLPFPTDIIQSVGVPEGHAVLGIEKGYFMGVGTASGKGGKIEYSDDYKFLEDLRTYKIKFYGNGRPKDINAFLYLDISDLTAAVPAVSVTGSIETAAAE